MSKLKNRAFTLLEVMLAVTILSVGLVLILRSYVTTLRAIKISQDFLVANLLLEEKIWQKQEELVQGAPASLEDKTGGFDSPFDKFNYKITFAEEEDLLYLYKSNFEVSWQQGQQGHEISCVTYLYNKEESEEQ